MDPLVGSQLLQSPSSVCLRVFPVLFDFGLILVRHINETPISYFPGCTEYNSDLSCHYKVELSYENLVTSGPDPHPPPIADDESDDEDDDDVPRVSEGVHVSCS